MSVEVGTGETKSEPNVVPLCDILLVLLIIFMVILPSAQRGIDIQLPETQAEGAAVDTVGKIVLTLENDQSVLLNQEPVPREMLETRLRSMYEVKREKTIFIRADASLTYNDVLDVIDIVKGAGVEVLGVMVTPYETESKSEESTSPTE